MDAEKLARLSFENEHLRQELAETRKIITELHGFAQHWNQKYVEVAKTNEEVVKTNYELIKRNEELMKQQVWLFNMIRELRQMLCNENCVERVLVWICEHEKFGIGVVGVCGSQLAKILVACANTRIEREDLRCGRLMEILGKNKIVTMFKQYKYPKNNSEKFNMIGEVWKVLMTVDISMRVIILGRVISEEKQQGHAEGFDLTSRKTEEERVTIFDPHNKQSGKNVDIEYFSSHLWEDEGIILYTVELENLKQIIERNESILHRTDRVVDIGLSEL